MSTTVTKPRRTAKAKVRQTKRQRPPRTPDYITILPPGEIIEEKMFEMGIDATELAKRMKVPVETVEQLLRFEIPLTRAVPRGSLLWVKFYHHRYRPNFGNHIPLCHSKSLSCNAGRCYKCVMVCGI